MKLMGLRRHQKPFYGWLIVGVAALLIGVVWGVTEGSFGVFIPPLLSHFDTSRVTISGVISILLVFAYVSGVVWGWLSDKWTVRGVVTISGFVMGLGMILASRAQGLFELNILYGVVCGTGLGGVAVPMVALIVRWFGTRQGLAIGITFSGYSLGCAILPLVADRLVALEDWRHAFLTLGVLCWMVVLLAAIVLKDPPVSLVDHEASKIKSHLGTRLTSLGSAGNWSASDPFAMTLFSACKTSWFWALGIMMFAGFVVFYEVIIHLVPKAVDAGFSPTVGAMMLSVLGVATMLGNMTGGPWGARLGSGRVYVFSMIVQAGALIALANAGDLWMYYMCAVIFGFGAGCWVTQIPKMAAEKFGTSNMGSIFGALQLFGGLGGLVGPLMAGYIFDITQSYTSALVLGAAVALVGILALPLGRDDGAKQR